MIYGDQYYQYFLHQAQAHPDLRHSTTNLAFAMVTVEEAVGDMRDADLSASGFIMRLFQPMYRFAPGQMGPVQSFDGGFLIARHYDQRDLGSEDYREAMVQSEKIAIDIIEKMYSDSQLGHPMFHGKAFSELSFSARERPVTGDGGFGGWIILWSLPTHFSYCSPATRAAWTDGGVTPFGE